MRKYLISKAYKLNRRRDVRAKLARQGENLQAESTPRTTSRKPVRRALAAFCAILAVGCIAVPDAAYARGGGNHGHHGK